MAAPFCGAQQLATYASTTSVETHPDVAHPAIVAVTKPGQALAPPKAPALARWLDINNLSGSLRFRSTANTNGIHFFNDGQHREILDGRFKFDNAGKYSIHFHGSSGRYINWAYADTFGQQFSDGIPHAVKTESAAQRAFILYTLKHDPKGLATFKAIASRGGYFYLRQLYAAASPNSSFALEFGSLPVEHGVSTEITTFDDDAYIAGERLRWHPPTPFFIDEVDLTSAYFGDPTVPNFLARGARLRQANYQQIIFKKQINPQVVASFEYNRVRQSHTLREAVTAKVPAMRFVDAVHGEFYQRVNDVVLYTSPAPAGSGFAASAQKAITPRLSGEAGFAHVDNNFASYSGSSFLVAVRLAWNSDSFLNGNHPFVKANWKVAPGLSMTGFYTHMVHFNEYSVNKQTIEGGFVLDLADWLHRGRIL